MTDLQPWSSFDKLVGELSALQARAREAAAKSVDEILTLRNWMIGTWIIAFQQAGADRARYGERLLDSLAAELKRRGAVGLGWRNLHNYRSLATTWPRLGIRQTPSGEAVLALPRILQTASAESPLVGETPWITKDWELDWQGDAWMERLRRELSFSHLLELSRVTDPVARAFYELHALKERWSVRELKRQRDSMLYERIGLSKDKDAVMALANQGKLIDEPTTIIRDPYILEFLGLPERPEYSEADLEAAVLDHLQSFLMELGGEFTFVGRQYRITVGGQHHFIDLLFFHRRLRCLLAIDLKIGRFSHADVGQMNFYLNYLRENVAIEGEAEPVGLILCADKDAEDVHYATGAMERQLFVSRYLTRLPSEEQLRAWLAEEREVLARRSLTLGDAKE